MADKQRFTLKQALPFLTEEERTMLGRKVARFYRITHKKEPTRVPEGDGMACAYTPKFLQYASKMITIDGLTQKD